MEKVLIDRNLLKNICMGASTVLRNPYDKRRAEYLKSQLDLVDMECAAEEHGTIDKQTNNISVMPLKCACGATLPDKCSNCQSSDNFQRSQGSL